MFVRGKSDVRTMELVHSMKSYGWEKDSVLLVSVSSEEDRSEANNPNMHNVHEGNTRTGAVNQVDKIQMVPVRIIKLAPGKYQIFNYCLICTYVINYKSGQKLPVAHAVTLARQKNFIVQCARSENAIDFFVFSLYTSYK